MIQKEQIIGEIIASLLKRAGGIKVNDVVVPNVLRSLILNKYRYHLQTEEFTEIGNELVSAGFFCWNANNMLSITSSGIENLKQMT
jgi:hypothetical protein